MNFVESDAGVCAAKGFLASGVSAGLKESGKLDMAMILSARPAAVAAVFTQNLAAAAPVVVSRRHASSGSARGVIVNSGGANACTGSRGLENAEAMAEAAAAAAGVALGEMLVCSTGLIGAFLPMDKVLGGIDKANEALAADDTCASEAIMTTDSVPKKAALTHKQGWSIGGICKGAGMIFPNMATMLAFVTTDAVVAPDLLEAFLSEAVEESFNSISVDGDTSTNDTLMVFANGASGIEPDAGELYAGLESVCKSLARQIVLDGEGATKLVTITIVGADSDDEAKQVARAISGSLLVKTMLFGGDANWGRIAATIGRAGVKADMDLLSIDICGIRLLERSVPGSSGDVDRARKALTEREVDIRCDLASGDGSAQMLTCDLTEEYIRINAEYEL